MTSPDQPAAAGGQRIDKWLWFVRVVKSRTLAASLVEAGKVRLNRVRIEKPAHLVRPGDVLTIAIGSRVRIFEVVAPGERRGPPEAARQLYRDLTPPPTPRAERSLVPAPVGLRDAGSGRPTKRDRRRIDRYAEDDHE